MTHETLSPAEVRVVQGLANGLTLTECGEVYGWPWETCKALARDARRTLGAKTNSHLVLLALRAGIIA